MLAIAHDRIALCFWGEISESYPFESIEYWRLNTQGFEIKVHRIASKIGDSGNSGLVQVVNKYECSTEQAQNIISLINGYYLLLPKRVKVFDIEVKIDPNDSIPPADLYLHRPSEFQTICNDRVNSILNYYRTNSYETGQQVFGDLLLQMESALRKKTVLTFLDFQKLTSQTDATILNPSIELLKQSIEDSLAM